LLLDIKPLDHQQSYNCIEDTIATVAKWWGRNYELMFSMIWGFSYYPSRPGKNAIVGNRFDICEYRVYENLAKYHGIGSLWRYKETADEQWNIILEEVGEGRPVIINADTFWVPWNVLYLKYHNVQNFLAVGFDESGDYIKCIDPYVNKEINLFKKENFKQANTKCTTLFLEKEENLNIDWREIIGESVARVTGERGFGNSFKAIREFSCDMKKEMILENEIKGYEDMVHIAPLFRQLNKVGLVRGNYGKMLNFLGIGLKVHELLEMSQTMTSFMEKWLEIMNLLIPACGKSDSQNVINVAADMLNQLADDEQNFSDKLYESVK
jgi:hypothetical protein